MRKIECEDKFDLDVKELKDEDITSERRAWLHDDIKALNAQIGIYECIIKDLKEINE